MPTEVTNLALWEAIKSLEAEVSHLRANLPSPLVDIKGAATHLSCSTRTIRRMMARREIPFRRVGSVIRFDLRDLRPVALAS